MLKILLLATLILAGQVCLAQETRMLQLTEGAGDHRYPAWSSDSQYMVIESTRDGNWELYLLKIEDRSIARLTANKADDRYPAWDPGGSRLLFQSTRTGTPELHLLDLKTLKAKLLIEIEGAEKYPDWSPDGLKMALSLVRDSVSQIVVLGADGTQEILAPSPFNSVWPRWAPDSQTLAFSSRRDTEGLDDEIYILSQADSTLRRVTDRSGHDFCPTWSPTGDRIATIGVEADGSRSLRIIPADGGAHQVLRTSFYRMTEPAWSPDGKVIAVAARSTDADPYHIFLVAVDR